MIIGLTGERGVGKSEIVKFLVEKHGYQQTHSFAPGKIMFMAYLKHKRVPDDIAYEMVYGNLRDVSSPYLPNNATPRFFMEKFGYFMGFELGAEWTLGVEIENAIKDGYQKLIVDSVVYEESIIRANNGIIVRVTRPGTEHNAHINAPNTNAFSKNVKENVEVINDGSLEELYSKIESVIHVAERF